ncbi:TPA: hypothetical protein DDZ86_05185 [Candidatus Dependentiae bacterium]|nr:hypothetical protein [Candidatus Dependentiae bacterium]
MKPVHNLWIQIKSYFKDYPDWVTEGVVALFLGLVLGFLFRTLGKYAVIVVTTLFVAGFVFHYAGLATFQSAPLVKFFGISHIPSLGEAVSNIFEWAQAHLAACVAGILGFILGWKLGV